MPGPINGQWMAKRQVNIYNSYKAALNYEFIAHASMTIVTGRGKPPIANSDTNDNTRPPLIDSGWDKCFLRMVALVGAGQTLPMAKCPTNNRPNTGAYIMNSEFLMKIDLGFLQNLYRVSAKEPVREYCFIYMLILNL